MSANTQSTAPVARLSGPADVVTALPTLLGFHPSESVVLLCLRGPRKRLCLTARLDLPTPRETEEVVAVLAAHARSARATRVLFVVVTEAGGGPVRRDIVTALARALRAHGIALEDAYRLGRGRWWAYLCADDNCCPAAGTPLPVEPADGVLLLRAERVAEGGTVVADRSAMVATLSPVMGEHRAELARRYARHRPLSTRESATTDLKQPPSAMLGLCRNVLGRYVAGSGRLTDHEAVQLCMALHDVHVRDAVLAWAVSAERAPVLGLLQDLVRLALPPHDAPACTVYAHVAYQNGDGALAMTALDRALATRPDYQLGVMLFQAIQAVVPPTVLAPAYDALMP